MDRRFLEFWGNYLLSLIQGGRKSDYTPPADVFTFWSEFMKSQKMADWFLPSTGIFEKQFDLFRRCYGLKENPPSPENSQDYFKSLKTASEEFQKSMKEYLSLFDVVPREEYDQLKQKYDELQEKFEVQGETIRQLRMRSLVKGAEEIGSASGIQDMIKTQTEQFTALMDSLGSIYGRNVAVKPQSGEKTKKEKKKR